MKARRSSIAALTLLFLYAGASAEDWSTFRGPAGSGASTDKNLPTVWSQENFLWKTKLPGLGSSTPITVGDKVFVTCYAGYGAKLIKTDLSKSKSPAESGKKDGAKGPAHDGAAKQGEPEDQK